jgi:ribosomal protein L5
MADTKYEPRLKKDYVERIRKALREQFSYANEMQIPRLDKIVHQHGCWRIDGRLEEAVRSGRGPRS